MDFQTALRLQRAGRLAEAAEIYRQILRRAPEHFDALHAFGMLRFQSGDLVEAERMIAAALRVNPRAADAHFHHGSVLLRLNRIQDSVRSFDAAIGLKPDFVEALGNRGHALANLKRFDEALADFDRIVSLRPNLVGGWLNRGGLLGGMGRPEEALASLERALKLEPANADARHLQADLLFWMNRYEERRRPMEPISPSGRGPAGMGQSRRRPRRAETACRRFDLLRESRGAQSGDAEAWSNCANLLFELKRFDEASEAYRKTLEIAPDLSYVRGFLAQCRLRTCDWRFLASDRAEIEAALRAGKPVLDPWAASSSSDRRRISSPARASPRLMVTRLRRHACGKARAIVTKR